MAIILAHWGFLIPLAIAECVGSKMLYDALRRRRAPGWRGFAKTYYVERASNPVGYWLLVALIAVWMVVVFIAFWTDAHP